jgi:tetratricopeptide (TPR) repeat protein
VPPQSKLIQTNIPIDQTPKGLKYLPFSRNYNFTGRTDEIDALERQLFGKQDCQRIAVVGLGGVGKTQVALKFAYSVLENYPDVSVFWLHALSLETFEQACAAVASELGILDMGDNKQDAKELVQRHLSAERAGKWMLVVDNADNLEVMEGSTGKKGIIDYLPQSELGMTVFTTRDKKTAHALAGNSILDVEKLDLTTASDLFKQTLTRKDLLYEEAVVHKLLLELDCLPLAITQAAAYINVNPVSINEYLGHLEGTESNLVYIMTEEMRDHTRYKHAANAVAKTWLVSFDQILRQDVHAASLLQYMSCIDWKAIPRSILPAIEPEARMTSAIGILWSYSFITTRSDGKTYDMHRLVHVAARVWIQQKELVAETQRSALEHLSKVFPIPNWDNREVWREYMPHAARIRDAKDGRPIDAFGELCLRVGYCLRIDGRIRDSVDWLEESYDLRRNLPDDNADKLLTQRTLAMVYRADGKVKDAIQLLEHIVATKGQRLTEDDHSRLASQHELASTYLANDQIKDAMQLLEHVLAIEQALAETHPSRLASQHELARAYLANNQVEDAVQLLEHVVAVKQALAETHPSRLASQHELAGAYLRNDQIEDAVQLLEHVVTIEARVLAEDHPDRLASYHLLAKAYLAEDQGRVQDAVQVLEHVVAIEARVLAEDHPDRLASHYLLAKAYLAEEQG